MSVAHSPRPPVGRTLARWGATLGLGLALSPLASAQSDARLKAAAFDATALDRVAWDATRDTPQFLAGDLGVVDRSAPAASAEAFLRVNAGLFGFEEAPETVPTRVVADKDGALHVFSLQTVRGVPVWGAESALHVDGAGRAYAWGGDVHPEAEAVDTTPALDARLATARALDDLGDVRLRENAPLGDLPAGLAGDLPDWSPQASLVVYPHDGGYRLAYHVRVFVEAPAPANWEVFVDAQSGAVLDRFNSIHTFDPRAEAAASELDFSGAPFLRPGENPFASVAAVSPQTGTGVSLYEGTYTLPTYLSGGNYYLYDTTRGPSYIRTMTGNNGTALPGSYVIDADNNFNAQSQKAAVDAHYGAVTTFDYFKNTHGRSSYNGANASITSTVNHRSGYNNAFWNGQQMVYGDGDGVQFSPLVELDIVAHELTHAVTSSSAGLIYQNESGALNEAVSDIMAVMVDRNDYQVGEQSYTPGTPGDALRDISNPPAGDQPDHYDDRYTGTGDNGGVHINSGIANKQAYLMIAGGTHRGVTVQSVGRSVTEKVWYRALTVYFTQSTNFAGARQGTLQAAADLYGSGSTQYNAVADAWAAVGVGSTSGGGTGGGTGTPEWRYEAITLESPHNYPNNYNNTKTYSKPGAQRVALYFSTFDTEANYDFVYIKDESGVTRATYTGNKAAFWAIVDGSAISANLVSDYSVTRYGYKVTQVAYFSDQALFAGSDDGSQPLGFTPQPAVSDVVTAAAKADALALAVGPNPARGAASVAVVLPEAGAVRVAVLDLLGREVAVAHDGALEAGAHTVALDAAALPAGLYVVVLEAEGQRLSQRLTVVR